MIDFLKLPSPCYVLDEELLDRNLATVDRVRRESGAEIIVALKACAMWSIFPELAKHSDGATASSAAEARLVFEEFGRPAHTYAPVYTDSNIDEILNCSDHITFNSLSQFRRFGQKALINGISCGLRINPQYSPVETDLYNPCVPGSRLGVTAEQLAAHGGLPAGVEGLHFHVLCESRPEHLQKALEARMNRTGLKYQPQVFENGWYCACGAFHPTEEDTVYCSECGCDRILLQNALNTLLQPAAPADEMEMPLNAPAAPAAPAAVEEPTRIVGAAPAAPAAPVEEPTRVVGAPVYEPKADPIQPVSEPTRVLDASARTPLSGAAAADEGTRVIPARRPAPVRQPAPVEEDEEYEDNRDSVAEALIRWVPPITAILCAAIALCGFVYYQFVL